MPPRSKAHAPDNAALLSHVVVVLGVVAAVIVFIVNARQLWFTQDDAFISYRYARHALEGHGLVFNIGERVEGYTNFLWVIWLVLCGLVGIDFDPAAKALGMAAGIGMIILAALLSRRCWEQIYDRGGHWAGFSGALIAGVNGSLAYWAVSGLETALFGFLVALAVWLWLGQSRLTPIALALATMTRPEGGLFWILLSGCEYVISRDGRRALYLFGLTAILLAPFGLFKLLYYGGLLPNPFYAKTGLAWEYVQSGLQYAWLFLRHYMIYGVMLLPVGIAVWKLPGRWKCVPLLFLIYTGYIIVIGGDVLRPHRFFVPILPLMAAAIMAGGAWLPSWTRRLPMPYIGTVAATTALLTFSITQPREILTSTRNLELGLIAKMTTIADYLRRIDDRPFTIAVSTIGKIAYDLPGRRIIDMLGLTDSTVARHPETIPGNETTWRERNFNATYVLSQDPDWILFSTGHKPSAPAERALILHSEFRNNYYTVLFPGTTRMLAIHKRKGPYNKPDEVWPDIELAHKLNAAYNELVADNLPGAVQRMHELKAIGPSDWAAADAFLATAFMQMRQDDSALAYAHRALAIDSFMVSAWQTIGVVALARGDSAQVAYANSQIKRLAPWLAN
ncbi:MAG TPA: hypothetical protein VNN55_00755 [bacterium]|nr:hypothetical protein [bacterium]